MVCKTSNPGLFGGLKRQIKSQDMNPKSIPVQSSRFLGPLLGGVTSNHSSRHLGLDLEKPRRRHLIVRTQQRHGFPLAARAVRTAGTSRTAASRGCEDRGTILTHVDLISRLGPPAQWTVKGPWKGVKVSGSTDARGRDCQYGGVGGVLY